MRSEEFGIIVARRGNRVRKAEVHCARREVINMYWLVLAAVGFGALDWSGRIARGRWVIDSIAGAFVWSVPAIRPIIHTQRESTLIL